MSLTPGTRLGPYEIQASIGAGGMGEVYKARDTRLDRTVAIKVISPLVAGSPELRDRFEREARTVSQLNHPNICTLHDVGHDSATDYLVLEYLDGESLADRLSKGPLAFDQALAIAMQICDALDKAHRAGIVHRDLKPGNVFLVRGATASAPPVAKLLDFGLAKMSTAVGPGGSGTINLTSPPTVTTPLTTQGTILGTFQYMAPEQLEGDEADARTDIWAFGCVLYEMLTGKKAFAGRTHASLISSIMGAQPVALAEAVPQAPPALDHVVRTCLAKDPAERFQTAHDLLLQLRWIATGGAQAAAAGGGTAAPRLNRVTAAAVVAGIAAVSAAATWALTRPVPAPPSPPLRATIDVSAGGGVVPFAPALALSPDGSRIVYAGAGRESVNLMMRPLDRFGPPSIMPGTKDGFMPFFSPDGAWLAFFADGRIRKMSASGGAALPIATAVPFGAVWTPSGIVFTDNLSGPLKRVSVEGGEPVAVTSLASGETSHRWPDVLPDGSIVFAANVGSSWDDARIVVQPADGQPRREIAPAGTAPKYVRSGHIAFARSGVLYAVPFDVKSLEVTGPAREVQDPVSSFGSDGRAYYAVTATGSLIYLEAKPESSARALVWVDRNGKVEPTGIEGRAFEHPRISPDGTRIALTIRDANSDIWTIDIARRALTRVTFEAGEDESPVWTPDGRYVTYAATRSAQPRATYRKPADNSGAEERLFVTKTHQHLSGWTPDGKILISEEADPTFGLYVGTLGDKIVKSYLQTQFAEAAAQVSPDGTWILYSSNESGRTEVYAQAFPGPGGRVSVSVDGGGEPRWAPNGREIFYRQGDRMMAVPVEYTPALKAGQPKVLFEGRFTRIGWATANYDLSPDGKRFLMIKGEDTAPPTQIHLVVNWADELRRLVPGR